MLDRATKSTCGVQDVKSTLVLSDDEILERARQIMRDRKKQSEITEPFTLPGAAKKFFTDYFIGLKTEVFAIAFLDANEHLIVAEDFSYGDVNSAHVSIRAVVKRALELEASNIVIAHNHPSNNTRPSHGDQIVTGKIAQALLPLGIKLLDHVIAGATTEDTRAFTEMSLMPD